MPPSAPSVTSNISSRPSRMRVGHADPTSFSAVVPSGGSAGVMNGSGRVWRHAGAGLLAQLVRAAGKDRLEPVVRTPLQIKAMFNTVQKYFGHFFSGGWQRSGCGYNEAQ